MIQNIKHKILTYTKILTIILSRTLNEFKNTQIMAKKSNIQKHHNTKF